MINLQGNLGSAKRWAAIATLAALVTVPALPAPAQAAVDQVPLLR